MTKRFQISLTVSFALLCGLVTGCGKREARSGGGPVVFTVDVQTVTARKFKETLFATGTLLAREAVTLQAERPGLAKEIQFKEGSSVKAGQVLVLLDDSELQAQLTRARAQLDVAMTAEARDRQLFEARMVSQADYEASRGTLQVARAEVALIEAQLEKTRVVAPFDGVAGLRQISPGAYLTPGTPIATLQDIRSLRIDFTLPERYLQWLRLGQPVTFRVAGRQQPFSGTIVAIEPSVTVDTRSLRIRAVASNEDQQLLPGSFAEVEVGLNEIPDAILVPPLAIVPGNKEQSVFVFADGKVQQRRVEIGLRTADAVQILSGLSAGEDVVTSGVLQLRSGMAIQPRRPEPEKPDSPVTGTNRLARSIGEPAK